MLVGLADLSRPRPAERRIAWVAGATGRLGDALVEQILASGRYSRVSVLACRSMATTVSGFEAVDLATLQARLDTRDAAPALYDSLTGPAHCDDCFLLLDPDARRALDDAARAHPGRRSALPAFEPLTDSDAALALAGLAARAGAARLLLLAPLQAWHQLSRATRLLPDGLELALARSPIPLVVIMKPTGDALPADPDLPEAATGATGRSTAAGRWSRRVHLRLRRFSRFYLSQLRFMLPTSSVVIRSVDLARLAVELVTTSDATGLKIIGVEWIEQRLRDKRGQAQPDSRRSGWRPNR